MATSVEGTPSTTARKGIDPRGPRFNAAVTAVILVLALVVPSTAIQIVLTVVQAAFFATGAIFGVQRTVHAWVFKTLIRPRLSAPTELEDPAPPRFAQGVGLAFTVVALIGFIAGVTLLAQIALAFALIAALLNAGFGFCLGCEVYLLLKRLGAPRAA